MIIATTHQLEGQRIIQYCGLVSRQSILGANVFRDWFAGLRDFFGGRARSYETVLREAHDQALKDMVEQAKAIGAGAIVGVDIDYATIGGKGSMLMVTAVKLG